MITRIDGTQRDLRKANRCELAVIANSLEARYRELSRIYRKGFDPPKQHKDRAEAEIFVEYENCRALRDYARLHGLDMSEEVDRALTRYSVWLGLSIGPETEEADDDDLLPAAEVIFSDNQASLLLVRKEYLQQRPEGFEWKTITPRAPNQGGRWERMVQSMKRAIRSLAKSDLLNEEEFRTILARSAELLNSRPIVKNPKGDPHDALTPNHFIWGKDTYGHEGGQPRVKNLNAAFERMERIQTDLWKRFHSEVLLEGRGKNKWRRHREGYEVGSLAIIIGDNPLQKTWLRGVITAIYPGEDGLIRNVAIRTPAGEFVRPSVKVIPIPKDPAFTIPSESENAEEDPDPDYPPSPIAMSPEPRSDSPEPPDKPFARDLPEDSGLPHTYEDSDVLDQVPSQGDRLEATEERRTPAQDQSAASRPPLGEPDSTPGSPLSPLPWDRGPRRREEVETLSQKKRFRIPRPPDTRAEDFDPPPTSATPRPLSDPREEERLTWERRKRLKLQSRTEKNTRDSS